MDLYFTKKMVRCTAGEETELCTIKSILFLK